MHLPDFFPNKVPVVRTAGFYINVAQFSGDRLVSENFVHDNGVIVLTGPVLTRHDSVFHGTPAKVFLQKLRIAQKENKVNLVLGLCLGTYLMKYVAVSINFG